MAVLWSGSPAVPPDAAAAQVPRGSKISSRTAGGVQIVAIKLGQQRSCQGGRRSVVGVVKKRSTAPNATGAEVNARDKENTDKSNSILHVQTLGKFPVEKLYGEVVMVRFDSDLMLNSRNSDTLSLDKALSTIKYLYNAGAKVLIVSSWLQSNTSMLVSREIFADQLSSLLKLKVVPSRDASAVLQFKMEKLEDADILLLDNLTNFKEEVANSFEFSKSLASGVSIFVNDAFSLSHRVLASTVGVSRFCHASLAGFHFEEELLKLMKISKTKKGPYVAIIGGSNFLVKAKALNFLASTCEGLVFIGKIAFQVMNGFGLTVPADLVEHEAVDEVQKLINLTQLRKVPIYFQKDFLCLNVDKPGLKGTFTYSNILSGWAPLDLGPNSLKEISAMLSTCKKVLLIGSASFGSVKENMVGTSQLALVLERISKNDCDVFLVGDAACKAFAAKSSHLNNHSKFRNASVVWEVFRGTTLPGVAALDRAYPYKLNWDYIFSDPTKPLLVDIGSGNGSFILKMARKHTDLNYLGLEINEKLVRRCLGSLLQLELKNSYFLSTNATSTFRSIVSSYPGNLVLASIQCPNPDFNREDQRWRMVQRALVEAIVDLLVADGKVFLQSDIEVVAARMKGLFIAHGKGKLLADGDGMGWLEENPFGVRTDWEQHVIERGDHMYRIMLRKV